MQHLGSGLARSESLVSIPVVTVRLSVLALSPSPRICNIPEVNFSHKLLLTDFCYSIHIIYVKFSAESPRNSGVSKLESGGVGCEAGRFVCDCESLGERKIQASAG